MAGIQDGFTIVNQIRDATLQNANAGTIEGALLIVLSIVLRFLAVVSVIVLVIGGVMYIFSLGNEDGAKRAKRLILYAIIGLIIVGVSVLLVNTLISFFFQQPAPPAG